MAFASAFNTARIAQSNSPLNEKGEFAEDKVFSDLDLGRTIPAGTQHVEVIYPGLIV